MSDIIPEGILYGNLGVGSGTTNYNDLDNKPQINSVTLQGNKTASDLGLVGTSDIPVTSVNGETGAVVLDGTEIEFSEGVSINEKILAVEQEIPVIAYPVTSVNGETGAVVLDGTEINYQAGKTINQKIDEVEAEIPIISYPVTSVNNKTGAVVLDGTDIEYSSGVSVNSQIDILMNYIPVYGNTASGAIATFDTSLALPLQDLQIAINAVQEGSGTPSPQNIRNLVGFTGANVAVKGANLFSLTEDTIQADRQLSLSNCTKTDTTVTATSTAYSYACFGRFVFLPKGTYTIKFQATSSEVGYTPTITVYRDGNTVVRTNIQPNTPTSFTITDDKLLEVRMFVTYTNDPTIRTVTFSDIQIEKGNSVSETYTPYVGNVTPITWQSEAGTVYGGLLDVTSGVLTIDYAGKTFDGTDNWSNYSGGNGYVIAISDMKSGTHYSDEKALCNEFEKVSDNTNLGIRIGVANKNIYVVQANTLTGVSDLATWHTWLSNNPLTVVYPLATPVTYQLTPTQISAIVGTNNVFTDTNGDTSVVYACSLKDYIDNQ